MLQTLIFTTFETALRLCKDSVKDSISRDFKTLNSVPKHIDLYHLPDIIHNSKSEWYEFENCFEECWVEEEIISQIIYIPKHHQVANLAAHLLSCTYDSHLDLLAIEKGYEIIAEYYNFSARLLYPNHRLWSGDNYNNPDYWYYQHKLNDCDIWESDLPLKGYTPKQSNMVITAQDLNVGDLCHIKSSDSPDEPKKGLILCIIGKKPETCITRTPFIICMYTGPEENYGEVLDTFKDKELSYVNITVNSNNIHKYNVQCKPYLDDIVNLYYYSNIDIFEDGNSTKYSVEKIYETYPLSINNTKLLLSPAEYQNILNGLEHSSPKVYSLLTKNI